VIERPQVGGPQFSPDGEWWWNGHEWVPARDAPHGKVGTSIVPAPSAGGQPVLISIGNIACTRTHVITPGGTYPLAGTTWIVSNNTMRAISESRSLCTGSWPAVCPSHRVNWPPPQRRPRATCRKPARVMAGGVPR
jgi:hypothetical protein